MRIKNKCIATVQKGVSFIELIIFLVAISIALVGLVSVHQYASLHAQQPLIQQQLSQLAESQLQIVLSRRYDENSLSNQACGISSACAGIRLDNGEVLSDVSSLDDVDDFNGYIDSPLSGYTRQVFVAYRGLAFGLADDQVKQIRVSVTDSHGNYVERFAYRVNH